MGYQVYLYEWPESQECDECKHCDNVWASRKILCELNHDKTEEDTCSCFTLPGTDPETGSKFYPWKED